MKTNNKKTLTPNYLLNTWNFQEYIDLFITHEIHPFLIAALQCCKNERGPYNFSNIQHRSNLQCMIDNIDNSEMQEQFKKIYAIG